MSIRCRLGFHDWKTILLVIANGYVWQHNKECRRCPATEQQTGTCIKELHCPCEKCENPPPPVRYCISELCGRPLTGNGSMCEVCWDEADAYTYSPPSGYIKTAKNLRQRELAAGEVCLHNSCQKCHGTGTTAIGTPCFHNIVCPCSKCSVR